jgi:ubiquitin-protein ligase
MRFPFLDGDSTDFNENSPEFRMSERVRNNRERHSVEKDKLLSAWSTIAIDDSGGYIGMIAGAIQPFPQGLIRDFKLVVPDDYPYDPPRAFSVNWLLGGVHCYSDTEMCLWQINQWTPSYTLAYAVAKTYVWIHKHEEWLRSGIWPGNQQRH